MAAQHGHAADLRMRIAWCPILDALIAAKVE
jgi:hypothetical protein